jgi:hypothetical protein
MGSVEPLDKNEIFLERSKDPGSLLLQFELTILNVSTQLPPVAILLRSGYRFNRFD